MKHKFLLLLSCLLLFTTGCQNTQTTSVSDRLPSLIVHFIDVGQADSIFIELPNRKTLLIDAGNNDDGALVCGYISSLKYSRLDYVIGSHPHEDHIGGLDTVINTFEVGQVFLPKTSKADTPTTQTYEDVLLAIANQKLKISPAKSGVSILHENGLSVDILVPAGTDYGNANNYSAVIKVVYGSNSFLFMGDAEIQSEEEITGDLSAQVLKVGHHGSYTSTSDAFLQKVSPQYGIISCGIDNSYGHPHKEIIEKLQKADIAVYRTDELGTVIISCDGTNMDVTCEKLAPLTNSPEPAARKEPPYYILNSNSKKIHNPACPAIKDISNQNKVKTTDFEKALQQGFLPCQICKPK